MSKARILTAGAGSSRYATHVPTNILEKTFLAASSSFRALANPRDARLVGVVGETTGHRALGRMLARMKRDPIGRTILQDRPLIGSSSLPLASLRSMPDGSLGCEYARFLETHRFNPDERTAVNFIDDPELAYVMLRYRQVHDLWHVVFALPPTFLGEVALKWLEAAQTGLPMCALGAFAGGVRLKPGQRAMVVRHVLPWALRHAASGADLLSVYYERELERPLDALRAELRVELLPQTLR
mmetsp:Transcript_23944/g.50206  ORF Transcript_23944/g.50206 Transcript_23944/m.50206 type:complete len:241 (+) Transcript_23944:257-979(+)